jgi:hypothetical protein
MEVVPCGDSVTFEASIIFNTCKTISERRKQNIITLIECLRSNSSRYQGLLQWQELRKKQSTNIPSELFVRLIQSHLGIDALRLDRRPRFPLPLMALRLFWYRSNSVLDVSEV